MKKPKGQSEGELKRLCEKVEGKAPYQRKRQRERERRKERERARERDRKEKTAREK